VWLSKGCNFLLRQFLKVPYRDMDTGFRLIRRDLIEKVAPEIRHMSFFTAEFVIRVHYCGARVVEVAVPHYTRRIGSTTIFFVSGFFWISLKQFIGILKMRAEFKKRGLFNAATPELTRTN
jgi:hypothetical protein